MIACVNDVPFGRQRAQPRHGRQRVGAQRVDDDEQHVGRRPRRAAVDDQRDRPRTRRRSTVRHQRDLVRAVPERLRDRDPAPACAAGIVRRSARRAVDLDDELDVTRRRAPPPTTRQLAVRARRDVERLARLCAGANSDALRFVDRARAVPHRIEAQRPRLGRRDRMRRAVRGDVGVGQRQLDDAQHLVAAQPGVRDRRAWPGTSSARHASPSGGDVTARLARRDRRTDSTIASPGAARATARLAVAAPARVPPSTGALPQPASSSDRDERTPHRGTRKSPRKVMRVIVEHPAMQLRASAPPRPSRASPGTSVRSSGSARQIVQAPAHAAARRPIEQLPSVGADRAMLGDDDGVLPLGAQDRRRHPARDRSRR